MFIIINRYCYHDYYHRVHGGDLVGVGMRTSRTAGYHRDFQGPPVRAPSIKAYMSLFSLMYTSILLNKAKYGGDLWVGEPRLVVDGLAQQHGVAQHLLLYVAVCVY